MTTDDTYIDLLRRALTWAPTVRRGMSCYEQVAAVTQWNMMRPIITNKHRRLNYAFMFGEAHWILTGQRSLDELGKTCGRIQKFSDDGRYMSGAYGPMFLDQRRFVIDKLAEDIMTRQAVMTFWKPSPRNSLDIPCTIGLQFLCRPIEDFGDNYSVDLCAFMRSSDVFLGIPYDVFSFSMIVYHVILGMKQFAPDLTLHPGVLTIMAGSQHLYENNRPGVESLVYGPMDNRTHSAIQSYYSNTPADLENVLATLRDNPEMIWHRA